MLLSQLCIVHKIELKHCYTESDCRTDLFAVEPTSGKDIELDVSFAVIPKGAMEDSAATSKREELKKRLN